MKPTQSKSADRRLTGCGEGAVWVAQRFSAAIRRLLSLAALATEVGDSNFRSLLRQKGYIVLRRNISFIRACAFMLLLGTGLCLAVPGPSQDDARTVSDFEARVTKYLDLRKMQAGSAPRPTNSPEKLADTQHDRAEKIKAIRLDAKQGDIFTPEIAAYFRRQISATLAGSAGHKIRASLRHAEPLPALTLHVNQVYPQDIPLQSTPPTLLLNLPKLPKELEYRIVGRNLVLHDIVPNIIVDFIPDAIPSAED